jgi:hypothetical protein
MNKTLYLHIGTPKTGTNSIQAFLRDNDAALRERGVAQYTPRRAENRDLSGRMRSLVEHMRNPDTEPFNQWLKQFVQRIEQDPAGTVIVSDELLWLVTGARRKRPLFMQFLSALQQVADVHILVYLRRQDNFLMSAYQQSLKGGKGRGATCRQWIHLCGGIAQTDYRRRLQWLLPMVGKDHLIVRPFETAQFVNGSLLADFLHCAGLDMKDGLSISEQKRNPGLSPFLAEILRCLAAARAGKNACQPLLWLKQKDGGRYFNLNREHQFLSPRVRCRIMKKHQAGNRWIARELLGRDDGRLFFDPLPDRTAPWRPYRLDEASVRSFFMETRELKMNPEQRRELCETVLAVIRRESGLLSCLRRGIRAGMTPVLRRLRRGVLTQEEAD